VPALHERRQPTGQVRAEDVEDGFGKQQQTFVRRDSRRARRVPEVRQRRRPRQAGEVRAQERRRRRRAPGGVPRLHGVRERPLQNAEVRAQGQEVRLRQQYGQDAFLSSLPLTVSWAYSRSFL
jgi:hypothetical protein